MTEPTHERCLQRVLFHPVGEIASPELYVRVPSGRVLQLERDSIEIGPYTVASTRTYFGRFPAAYYQRWTELRSVLVRGTASGRGRLRVYASDDVDRERIVGVFDVDATTPVEVVIEVEVDRFLDGGFLWVDLESGHTPLRVRDLRFEATDSVAPKPVSVVICTFNRARDCLETIRSLGRDPSVVKIVSDVIVVDQGTDKVKDRPGFESAASALGGRLHYIEQRNLGGAGGFTRGMYEALGDGSERDIVLMDDDIVLEPETVLRMAAFSARTIQPIIVGAQMLYLFHPNVLHTSAEDADLARLRAGVPVHAREAGIDVSKRLPYRWAEGGYNAWWTCLVPSSVVERVGYPLPLFFQWDDIEFGLRARGKGIPTATLPGSAVWHADFAMKDHDDWSRYFSVRNSMVVAALHSHWSTKSVTRAVGSMLFNQILSLQYGLAATTLLAIEGFLAGPESVANGSAEVLGAIREERSKFADTVRHLPEEMVETGLFALPAIHAGKPPRHARFAQLRLSLRQILGMNRLVGKIASAENHWYHTSQFNTAIVTDAALDTFRIRVFDRKIAGQLVRRSIRALQRLNRHGARAAAAWRSALPELSSRESWSRVFAGRND